MTQVTRLLGFLGWLLLVAPLTAQTIPNLAPSQRMPTAPANQTMPMVAPAQQQPRVLSNNPNQTGAATANPNLPGRGQTNPSVNPPLRTAWPAAQQQPRTAPRAAVGQPAQNMRHPGAAPRQATLPQHLKQQPPQPPRAPFQLTPAQQAEVDQVLKQWEEKSAEIRTFKCPFTLFEYNPGFLKGADNIAQKISKGKISFVKPDKGKYEITELKEYNLQSRGHEVVEKANLDHWVCTGDAIYIVNKEETTIQKQEIPVDQRGKAIADGPLPFLFGAKAEKLRQRYWIRITQTTETEIWLEVFPRWQGDAANYSRVELILDREEFLPRGLLKHSPGGQNRESYTFGEASVNSPLDRFMPFTKPRVPFGWTLKDTTPRPQAPPARPVATNNPLANTPRARQ